MVNIGKQPVGTPRSIRQRIRLIYKDTLDCPRFMEHRKPKQPRVIECYVEHEYILVIEISQDFDKHQGSGVVQRTVLNLPHTLTGIGKKKLGIGTMKGGTL